MKKLPILVDKKIIYVDYEITSNKNMYLKVTRDNNILVTAPISISENKVKNFVGKNIKKFLKYIETNNTNILYSLSNKFIFYEGIKHKLQILTGNPKIDVKVKNNYFYIYSQNGSDQECTQIIKAFFKQQLLIFLKKRHFFWEKEMNVEHHTYRVTYKFSTWGSNNVMKKSISYSSRLAHFSNDVKDYLIVHELAHALEPNHSAYFYKIVSKYIPNYVQIQKILKSNLRY